MKAGRVPDWGAIKRAVLRSRPAFAEDIEYLICFLATRSGGVEGIFLKEFLAFHSTFVKASQRMLPGSVYGAAAEFPWHNLAHAFCKVAFTCPQTKLSNGRCNWVNKSDFTKLRATTDAAVRLNLEAGEKILSVAREDLPLTGIKEPIAKDSRLVEVFTKLDINMGRLLLDKQEGSKKW